MIDDGYGWMDGVFNEDKKVSLVLASHEKKFKRFDIVLSYCRSGHYPILSWVQRSFITNSSTRTTAPPMHIRKPRHQLSKPHINILPLRSSSRSYKSRGVKMT